MTRIFREDEGTPEGDTQAPSTPKRPVANRAPKADLFEATSSRLGESPPPPPPVGRPSERPLFEDSPGPELRQSHGLFRPDEGAPIAQADRHRRGRPARRRRRRKVRLSRYATATLGLFFLIVVADGAYVALGVRSSLLDVADRFERSDHAFRTGEVTTAKAVLEEALESARHAVSLTRHPSAAIAAYLPRWGADVRAVASMAHASELASRASLEAAAAAIALGATDEGLIDAVYRSGVFQLELIEAAYPHALAADDLMQDAVSVLLSANQPSSPLVGRLLEDARNRLIPVSETIHTATVLGKSLPGILGKHASRRYLLAFQALGEARGTGGLIGLVGVLEFDRGIPRLYGVEPVLDVFDAPIAPVDAPGWFAKAYGGQGALQQPQQANVSPNYPVAAEVFMRMYEQKTGRDLDGMIALDAHAFGLMLEATGPVRARGLDATVTSANAVEVLLHDSYLVFPDEHAQNSYYGRLVEAFWDEIQAGGLDATRLGIQLGEATRIQHAKVYFRNKRAQRSMVDLKATGDYALWGANTQLVFANNYSVNKIDYFVKRSISTVVKLDETGDAKVTTRTTLKNLAPTTPTGTLIGPGILTDPPGMSRSLLSFLLPVTAGDPELTVNGRSTHLFSFLDEDAPVAWQIIETPSGQTTTAKLVYRVSQAFRPGAGDTFSFALVPQTSPAPDRYTLRVLAPEGLGFTLPSGEVATEVRRSGVLDAPLKLELPISRR